VVVLLTAMTLFIATAASAAGTFYEGKTVRITVGFSAGGGFDLWARLIARHMGRHIPGNPTIIVENVTGAGGLIQTNQLYRLAKADGLTIGHINGGLILAQLLGQPGYDFDSQKFVYIGAANKDNPVLVFSKASGITSVDQWRAASTPVKVGTLVPGNMMDNAARIMSTVLGFPTQVIPGYKGAADLFIAMDGNEIAGCPPSWDNLKTNRGKAIAAGDLFVVVQGAAKPLKELPNVPRMIDLARTDEQKKFVEIIIHYANDYSRVFAVPPATPKERVDILRAAFQETMLDPEFLAEIEKMKLTLDISTGEELTRAVAGSAALDDATRAKLKDILFK
jgi:tripartite-type tricarboxylate transporter receptor subunit TctC